MPIHPNVVKACRPRYRAAGGKSDPGDAFMLADILRTDGHRFRPLAPCSDEIKALRALVRGRDELVAGRIALANRLRSLLDGFWPGAAAIFADVDSPIALAFLRRYPTPDSAARLGESAWRPSRRAPLLRSPRPAELLARLRAAPTGRAGEAEAEAKGEMVGALAAVLSSLVGEIAKLTSRIENAVADAARRPDRHVLPEAGRICAAQILAELGDVRERFRAQTSSPPKPASARSPTPPARAAASSSAGHATIACGGPSPASPTTRRHSIPLGSRHLQAPLATEAAIIPTPSASSPAPGYASSGAPGTMAHSTTAA